MGTCSCNEYSTCGNCLYDNEIKERHEKYSDELNTWIIDSILKIAKKVGVELSNPPLYKYW